MSDLFKYFEETEESREINFQHEMMFITIFVMFVSILLSLILVLSGLIILILKYFNKAKNINLKYFFVYPQSIFFITILACFILSSYPNRIEILEFLEGIWFLGFTYIGFIFIYLFYKKKKNTLLHYLLIYPCALNCYGFFIVSVFF